MPIVDIQRLRSFDENADVDAVAAAIGWSSFSQEPNRLRELAEEFVAQPDKALYVELDHGCLVGIVAIERCSSETVTIRQIGVHPCHRKQGIGRALVHYLARAYPKARIKAETDRDAVGFYRTLGFHIESLGEKYPGIERFLCTLDS